MSRRPIWLAAIILGLGALAAQPQAKQAKYDPEGAIPAIRLLLSIAEEAPPGGSTCDEGLGSIGQYVAILLAYHDSGINAVHGSCKKATDGGDLSCFVELNHRNDRKSDEQYGIFKFKVIDGKAQASSLECEFSP